MFVGHYAASLALKKVDKNVSLGLLFLAVQFVDILFFPLVLMGVERLNVIENFTQSTHFELPYMPYTHSLLGTLVLAGLVYLVFRVAAPRRKTVALVMGIGVLSHWFFDLIVHTPDLPLWNDASTKLGFGLWNNAIATFTLEALFLAAGLWLYLKATRATSALGKYGMVGFVGLLLVINAVNIFGPPFGDSKLSLAVSALVLYLAFAGAAHWLDRKRA